MANWIIPCNLKYYDVFGAFDHFVQVQWRQVAKAIDQGDIVYIYVGKPVQAIVFKCLVVKTDIPLEEADGDTEFDLSDELEPFGRYMQLKLLKKYPRHALTFDRIVAAGYRGSIQSQRHTGEIIQSLIDAMDEEPLK